MLGQNFKICSGSGTHTFTTSRIHRLIIGTAVDAATVALRFATTDDNLLLLTCSGAVPFDIEVGLDFNKTRTFELVASGATEVTVVYG